MTAVVFALFGVAVMVVVLGLGALLVRRHDHVHRVVSDHGFAPWFDVWRLSGRGFGGQKVGDVTQCQRALVDGVPVELLEEAPGPSHPRGSRWLVAAQVDRSLAFEVASRQVTGTVPATIAELVDRAAGDRSVDVVLVGGGLLVARATSTAGIERCLRLVVTCAQQLGRDNLPR